MNSIDNFSNKSSLVQLEADLQKHLEAGDKCTTFFTNVKDRKFLSQYNKTVRGLIERDYTILHYNNMGAFSIVYGDIFNRSLEKWESEYEQLKNGEIALEFTEKLTIAEGNEIEPMDARLGEVKKKIELCKNVDALFRKEMIALLRKNAELLLLKDSVFFLPTQGGYSGTLWECHCCDMMGRERREQFSTMLSRDIKSSFAKEMPLTIASIGAGLCFHELEIHAVLTGEGYKIDRWVIVDPNAAPNTIANFKSILQYENPNVEVLAENIKDDKYFDGLQNGSYNHLPDVFLYLDADLWCSLSTVEQRSLQMKHHCLFVDFRKNCYDSYDTTNVFEVNGKK